MEHNEDRDSLINIPTSTLPPPPRFDAEASAAARPVEPLPRTRIQVPLTPKISRLINKRSKFLALMAIVGLATGAAGGILVIERDKQQRVVNSASMIPIPTELTPAPEAAAPAAEISEQSLEVSETIENQAPVRRPQRRPRKPREPVVLLNADEEEEEEWDREEDDDNDKDQDDEDRKKDRERRRKDRERSLKDRERDADSRRNESTRQRAVFYDTMRARKP